MLFEVSSVPNNIDDWFKVTTGISGQCNNWLLMAEQAATNIPAVCLVCMGLRPIMKVVPVTFNKSCIVSLMKYINLSFPAHSMTNFTQ